MQEIKELLTEFKERGIPGDLMERQLEPDWMEKKANILVGIRRAGKTYSLYQIMKRFNFRDVFYLNLEDDRIINPNIRHLTNLVPTIGETFETGKKIYLFVDEIQNVDGWEKWARRMAERPDIVLFISGSSSKLSSFEIPTALRGRSITNYVFPLDFREFLRFRGFDFKPSTIDYSTKKPDLKRMLNEFMAYGGFPEIVTTRDRAKKIKLLREYFSTIIAKDITERHRIDNTPALETLMKYLLNNYSRYITFSKTQKWMNTIGIKVGKATLLEFYRYVKQSFFVNHTSIFSYKIKDILQYPIKVYVADTGFITGLTIKQRSLGWASEQAVGNELFRRAIGNPFTELYYWKDRQQNEVDFVVKGGERISQLIQVCHDISDSKTKERETRALLKASKELKCKNLLIITEDHEAEEKTKGKTIKFIPLWKWLLA